MDRIEALVRRLTAALARKAKQNPKLVGLAITALCAWAGVGIVVTTADINGDGLIDTVTIERKVQVTKSAPAGDLQTPAPIKPADSELRDESPPGVSKEQLKAADGVENEISKSLPDVDNPLPVGGAQNYSCRQDYSGGVYSSRGSAKVMQFVLHYTVSANRKGWADVTAIRDYFKRTRVGSAHLILDFEGHCLQMVPWSRKAWTQGNFNPVSESVEIIATGKETRAQWLAAPIFKKQILASIVRDRLRARGLPRKFVDPTSCVARLGYTDHNHLECGNDHTDVAPAFPFDVLKRQLADGPGAVTPTDRVTCRKINSWRKAGKPYGGQWSKNTQRRVAALAARGVKCLKAGPVKT